MKLNELKPQLREILKREINETEVPLDSIIAGGAVSNALLNLLFGEQVPINDIDIFKFSRHKIQQSNMSYYGADFEVENIQNSKVQLLRIHFSNRLNYKNKVMQTLHGFNINAVQVGYDWHQDELYYTKAFDRFLGHRKLLVNPVTNTILARTISKLYKKHVEGVGTLDPTYLDHIIPPDLYINNISKDNHDWLVKLANDNYFPNIKSDRLGNFISTNNNVYLGQGINFAMVNYKFEFSSKLILHDAYDSALKTLALILDPTNYVAFIEANKVYFDHNHQNDNHMMYKLFSNINNVISILQLDSLTELIELLGTFIKDKHCVELTDVFLSYLLEANIYENTNVYQEWLEYRQRRLKTKVIRGQQVSLLDVAIVTNGAVGSRLASKVAAGEIVIVTNDKVISVTDTRIYTPTMKNDYSLLMFLQWYLGVKVQSDTINAIPF